MNALASAIRGTGNMLVPSAAVCVGVALLVPLSPVLIFGYGPIPAMGIAGAGAAVLLTTGLTGGARLVRALGRSVVRPRRARLRWHLFGDILRVGVVGSVSTLQTTLTVALTTALVGAAAGPDAVAGYGTGSRLEYLLIPLVFGLGAPLVALVGTNIGAGQQQRALRAALLGGAVAFCRRRPWASRRRSGRWPGSACSAATRRCWRPAPPICASSGRPTASSGWACASISPPRAPAGCFGRCWRAGADGPGGRRRLGGAAPDRIADLGIRGPRRALVVYGSTLAIAIASGVWFRG